MQIEGLWGQTSQSVSVWLAVGPYVLSLTRLPSLSFEMHNLSCHYPGLLCDKHRIQTDLWDRLIVHDGSHLWPQSNLAKVSSLQGAWTSIVGTSAWISFHLKCH